MFHRFSPQPKHVRLDHQENIGVGQVRLHGYGDVNPQRRTRTTAVGYHENAPHRGHDADCTEEDALKRSDVGLFYLRGISAIVKLGRAVTVGDQNGRPLCCVEDAQTQNDNDILVEDKGRTRCQTSAPCLAEASNIR
jgi:hypothetical protein